MNSEGSEIPTGRGNKMLIDPRRESRFRQLGPIKNKIRQKEKFEMGF
jgi:hypothetical protein